MAPISPDRDDVLTEQDGQQDRCRLQRRHAQREQRSGDHAEPRKAALAEAEREDCGDRQQIEQRIDDDGHSNSVKALRISSTEMRNIKT